MGQLGPVGRLGPVGPVGRLGPVGQLGRLGPVGRLGSVGPGKLKRCLLFWLFCDGAQAGDFRRPLFRFRSLNDHWEAIQSRVFGKPIK